jgi:hypothetical protein
VCFSLTRRRRCRDELAEGHKRHEYHPQDLREGASPLHPEATATCVRVRTGNRLATDGPFAKTTEQLGGFFLVEAANLDEAFAIAGRIPAASKGTVEIRPSSSCPDCHRRGESSQAIFGSDSSDGGDAGESYGHRQSQ